MKILPLSIFLTLVSLPVIAGGTHELIEINELKIPSGEKGDFILTFIPIDGTWEGEKCTTVRLEGLYDQTKWSHYKRPMTFSNHKKSLKTLFDASQEKNQIYFGVFGKGVKRISDCSYISNGLFSQNIKGNNYIYSVYERI